MSPGGMLVVLEGIDGAGTTTQAKRLCQALDERDIPSHLTREPSDGPVGRLLRQILAGQHAPTDATTHALLFAADRADHVHREVQPALSAGKVVVSDRWYHSSLAYQGAGEDRAWIADLNKRALVPTLTLFLQVDAEVAAARRHAADRVEELFDAQALQRRIAANYLEVIGELRDRESIVIVDGERDMDEIAEQCLAEVLRAREAQP